MSIVFSDDFSTDPNTSGLWTVHRLVNDPTTTAVWDARAQNVHLTRTFSNLGVAMFANYELAASDWKATFRYRTSKLGAGGADGFVFMFYKDNDAYGAPAYGDSMGFEIESGDVGLPVTGYGIEFDHYFNVEWDPSPNYFVGLLQDNVCNSLTHADDPRVADGRWHNVEVRFFRGVVRLAIDGEQIFTYQLSDPDYTFSGVGFGAGTGDGYADHQIDNFQLSVR